MNPIDCPWIVRIGFKRIRDIRGNQDILVFLDLISFVINMVCTFSIRAINKHGIIDTLVFLYGMKFYFWEKTDFTNIQIFNKRVVAVFFQQFFR